MNNKLIMASAAFAALAISGCGNSQPAADATDSNTMNDTAAVAPADTQILPPAEGSAATAVAPATTAQAYVDQAAVGDMFEIESSKVALDKSTSQPIKDFAQQMIDAHTATTEQLKATLTTAGLEITPPAELDAAHQTMLQNLNSAAADDFDKTFVQQQTQAHQDALALHRGYATAGDNPQLQQFASETAPKVEQHLEMVKTMETSGS